MDRPITVVQARATLAPGAFYETAMTLGIELDREDDGRWLAEVPDISGVMCYSETYADAVVRVVALALRVIADRLEHGEADSTKVKRSKLE